MIAPLHGWKTILDVLGTNRINMGVACAQPSHNTSMLGYENAKKPEVCNYWYHNAMISLLPTKVTSITK